MTPQDFFQVMAPLPPGGHAGIDALLAEMCWPGQPGRAHPANPLIPFGDFPNLHFARLLVIDDPTLADRAGTGLPTAEPAYLALLGSCDGTADAMLAALAEGAAPGLRALFRQCGLAPDADVFTWLRAHAVRPATGYVNWVGRTVAQVREEALLHRLLVAAVPAASGKADCVAARAAIIAAVKVHAPTLTPEAPTPMGWLHKNRESFWLPLLAFIVALVLVVPRLWLPLLIGLALFAYVLRRRERADPVIAPQTSAAEIARRSAYEDHDVTNAFSAIGSLKPGRFRLWLTIAVLWGVNWTTRHIFTKGRLARVGTIHFARWVLIDDNRRLFFASDYDGPLETYMDDFINKVSFGLNAVFSNGIGWPRTDWLVLGGARDEQVFKRFLRYHQCITQVHYKAYPGLTTYDLARNARLRQGYQARSMTEVEARTWLAAI